MNDINSLTSNNSIDKALLFQRVSSIIEKRKFQAAAYANREVTLMFWEVGQYINSVVLDCKRAAYGKQIVVTLSRQLVEAYGKSFEEKNLRRMIQFSEAFPDYETISVLTERLSWSHFLILIPMANSEAKLYYAQDAAARQLGVRALRQQIARKAYERQEIANAHLTEESSVPFNVFKDPYLLDTLGLHENYLEADLEKAILLELENFILEFGHGFSFVARQKRMIIDDDDFTLDLLFYHRLLKRLVAIELKLGKFKPQYKGQMEFYLRWLNRYERAEGENAPIGIILCTKASRGQIELLEMDKSGIAVAEYWTNLPPKAEFERKIQEILCEAQERLERRKRLPVSSAPRLVDYFIEPKDDEDD